MIELSFKGFSEYIFEFRALDSQLPNIDDQNKYYNRWMKDYSLIFKNYVDCLGIEWDLRCRKSLREIFSSATFFIEAKKTLEIKCFSSYHFCLYYSLFHAIYSTLFLNPKLSLKALTKITHRNSINLFYSNFCNGKSNIVSRDIKELFGTLKYMREYYSYVTPFNNIFDKDKYITQLEQILKNCYQLSSFHSLMIEHSYSKKIKKVERIDSDKKFYYFIDLFNTLFAKQDDNGGSELDPSCIILRDELIQWGLRPNYFVIELEHQFDEFHTYNNFYNESCQYDLKVQDIVNFIYSALVE